MLYVVGTPIGNQKDITLRAIEVLKNVDTIYCEDTRQSIKLLKEYGISKPLVSLHQHTHQEKLDAIIRELKTKDAAYVTDAGTPAISDPGGKLVEECQKAGIKVVPIPGASSVTALLSVAGVRADSYWFAGYVPTKKGRQTFLKKIIAFDETTVVFETAPRLLKFLHELVSLGCSKKIIVGRELTKQFEEVVSGSATELIVYYASNPAKGEFVIALA